jgi:hypothetical protein
MTDFVRLMSSAEEQQVLESTLFTLDFANNAILTTAKIEIWFRVAVNTRILCRVSGWSEALGRIKLLEGVAVSAFGTIANPINRDRSAATTPATLVYTGPTVTNDGSTLMEDFVVGASTDEREYVLDAADYTLRLENLDAATKAGRLTMEFYEI